MADFDPYLKWLGIRDPQRPVHFYRLLGLELYENDPEIIANAADRQMVHVRSYQGGPQGELSQQMLSELTVARRCLLTMDEKVVYDNQLRQSILETETPPPVVADGRGEAVAWGETANVAPDEFSLAPPEVVTRPDSIPNFPAGDAPPDLGGGGNSRGKIGVKSNEDLRGRRNRRDKNQFVWTLFAWLTSAVAAVAVSAYILNSGMIPGLDKFPNPFANKANKETDRVTPLDSDPKRASNPDLDRETLASSGDRKDRGPALLDPNAGNPKVTDPNADPFNAGVNNPDPFNVNLESSTSRLPQPSRYELSRAESELESQYGRLMSSAADSNSGKRRLASTMLADVKLAEPGSANHFALLDHSARWFTRAGDLRNAASTLKQMQRAFEVDYWKMIRKAVDDAADNAGKQDEADFKLSLDGLIDEASSLNKFDEANRLIGTGISRAIKVRDDRLRDEYKLKRQRLQKQERNAGSHP